MAYLVLRFGIWTAIFTCLFWRLIAIVRVAVRHLQRLHQIPCSKCAYFTGDYRLKCTVQPMLAMSEEAIGCRDFLYRHEPLERHSQGKNPCGACMTAERCGKAKHQQKHLLSKPKFTYLK
ncbi:MAG: hypothetical protein AAFQ41_04900 [Cyanobacteria bacterium J06623_7]